MASSFFLSKWINHDHLLTFVPNLVGVLLLTNVIPSIFDLHIWFSDWLTLRTGMCCVYELFTEVKSSQSVDKSV